MTTVLAPKGPQFLKHQKDHSFSNTMVFKTIKFVAPKHFMHSKTKEFHKTMVFFYNSKNTLYLNRAKNLKAMLYMDH
jgi:hypothetical protein